MDKIELTDRDVVELDDGCEDIKELPGMPTALIVGELHGPPAYYTPDWDAARDSVRRLAALPPVTFAPSHGLPIAGPHATQSLIEFAEIARPEHGRHVRQPAERRV